MVARILITATLLFGITTAGLDAKRSRAAEDESKVYQLRTYFTAPGKLDVLLDRFEATNLELFGRHQIELIGAWTAADESVEPRLTYLVRFPSKEAGEAAWEAFGNDPEWQQVFGDEKDTHGTVVTKVETVYLAPTDYSPVPLSEDSAKTIEGGLVYELRTYTANTGKLENLNARFRNHTLGLFAKHGMTNIVYTMPIEGENGNGETLTYLIAHKSQEAAGESWNGFINDPEWQKVFQASRADGTPLVSKIVRIYLKPTSFSKLQ